MKKGRSVVSETETDINALPEYYIIRVILTDKSGKELSSEFTIYKYDRAMQELINSDIHDYNEEYVVNLDESEETNFIVLSEDTVMAESSEQENTLISADYDNEVYTFDNIDDSIRNLENGDYFYVRPSENDIIMLNVKEVNVNGDEATIVGGGEVDDMLAAMKVETTADLSGATADITTADPDVYFPDYDEETGVIDMSDNKLRFEYRPDINLDLSATRVRALELNDMDLLNLPIELRFSGQLTTDTQVNIYKKKKDIDAQVQMKFTLKISAEAEISYDKIQLNKTNFKPFAYLDYKLSNKLSELIDPNHIPLGELVVPTKLPGVLIDISPSIGLTFAGTLKVTKTLETIQGCVFEQHKNKDGEYERDFHRLVFPDSAATDYPKSNDPTVYFEGSCSISLNCDCSLVFLHPNILKIGIVVSVGLEAVISTPEISIYDAMDALDAMDPSTILSVNKVINMLSDDIYIHEDKPPVVKGADVYWNPEAGEEKEHICDYCFPGTLSLFFEVGFNVEIFNEKLPLDKMLKVIDGAERLEIPLFDFYFSSEESGFRTGECPHYRYRTTLKIVDEEKRAPIPYASVTINGVETITNLEGEAFFYAVGGKYDYSVKIEDQVFINDKIILPNAPFGRTTLVKISHDAKGKNIYQSASTETTPVTTSTTVSNTTMASPQFKTDIIDEDKAIIDSGRMDVGKKSTDLINWRADEQPEDAIFYNLYKNGYMNITGYGEMFNYNPDNCPSSNKIVKENTKIVEFDDIDPEGEHKITSVGSYSFANCENLETVVLPANIESIDSSAFSGCTNLRSITYEGSPNAGKKAIDLPPSLKSIGDSAFKNCSSLEGELDFTNLVNLNTIEQNAFSGCTGITIVKIPNSLSRIDFWVFYKCDSITDMIIPESIKINNPTVTGSTYKLHNLFSNVTPYVPSSVKKITLSKGDIINKNAFSEFTDLETVVLPATIETIDAYAFRGCKNLKSITYEGSPNAGKKAIDLPPSLKIIGDSAFSGCSSLEGELDLTGNSALEEIGSSAFSGCEGITSVHIPGNVKAIDANVFNGCTNLKEAIIEPGVEIIQSSIFDNCILLEEVSLPFAGFDIEKVNDPDNRNDGSIISYFGNGDMNLKTINILGGKNIPFHMFHHNSSSDSFSSLETINIISDTVVRVEENAFEGCTAKNINFYSPIKTIENGAFLNCSELKAITLPDSLEELGEYSFKGCTSLEKISLPDKITKIPSHCFQNCSSLKSIKFPDSLQELSNEFLFNCTSIESITIPGSVEIIPHTSFRNCQNLKRVILLEGVQQILGKDDQNYTESFYDCDSLSEIYIPKSFTMIGQNSFGVTINDDFGTVYYGGTEEEWEALKATQMKNYSTSKLNGNDSIFNANVIFNAKPEDMSSYVASQEEFVPSGDVNGNSKLDLGDALAILQYIANSSKYPLSEEAIKQADVYNTGDGITPMDALAIQQYDAGLIDSLPVYR